jgi:hypothetical protein
MSRIPTSLQVEGNFLQQMGRGINNSQFSKILHQEKPPPIICDNL